MTEVAEARHRLEGLEPDNLLAFLALLGLMRALDEARPDWRPRVAWDDSDDRPLRPLIVLREAVDQTALCEAAAAGTATLAAHHDFGGRKGLDHTDAEARAALEKARNRGGHAAAIAAALMNDAVVKDDGDRIEPTPLCLLFGQGHQHFLERLAAVPNQPAPPPRGRGKKTVQITAAECLAEALFAPWARPDPTFSFRWDPAEDVRYALMFGDPSNAANKDGTQHGANRLAAIGLSCLPVAPAPLGVRTRPMVPGGRWKRGFHLTWPVWRTPVSLDAVIALMNRNDLDDTATRARFDIDHTRRTSRISVGKFMNFTRATSD